MAHYKLAAQLLTKEREGVEALARSVQLERSAAKRQEYARLVARLPGTRYSFDNSRLFNGITFDDVFTIVFSSFDSVRQTVSGTARIKKDRCDWFGNSGCEKFQSGTVEFAFVGALREDVSDAAVITVQLRILSCAGHPDVYCKSEEDAVRSPSNIVLYEDSARIKIDRGPGFLSYKKDVDLRLGAK